MIKVNLKERIQVVRPFDRVNFGRFVATREDIVRRRLLVSSFNSLSAMLRRHFDFIDGLVSHESFIRSLDLDHPSLSRLIRTGRLREKDVSLHLLRRRQPYEGISELIRCINSACSTRQINGQYVEAYMADVPLFPGSVLRLRPTSDPGVACWEDPRKVKRNFKSMILSHFEGRKFFRRNRVYTESQIRDIYVKRFGQVNQQTIQDLILEENHHFHQLIRPRAFDQVERSYAHFDVDYRRSGTVPVYVSRRRGWSAAAYKSELDQLRREGRLVIVREGNKTGRRWVYFTPQALAEGLEQGFVREVDKGIYVVGTLTLKPRIVYRSEEESVSAAGVFLEYVREQRLSARAAAAYPFLATAIEVLRASPVGAEQHFEAALLAAAHGVPEQHLAALLLRKDFRPEPHRLYGTENWYLNHNQTYRYQDYLFELMRDKGLTSIDCELHFDQVRNVLRQLDRLLSASPDSKPPARAEDVVEYLRWFSCQLEQGKEAEHLQATYLSAVLARLRRVPAKGLEQAEERQLRIVTASMAERLGFSDLAAEIRDQLFRISHNREWRRMRALVERAYGLSYPELEAHMGKTADLAREVLDAVNIPAYLFDINGRVKLPYSAWEKMQSIHVASAGLLKDMLGLGMVAADDALAYRVMDLMRQAFLPVARGNFRDRFGLVRYLGSIGYEPFMDQILEPRGSGFTSLFYHCLTELKLPMELQVTSRERDKVNRSGKAAHWKHKIRREVESTYGIRLGELPDLDAE